MKKMIYALIAALMAAGVQAATDMRVWNGNMRGGYAVWYLQNTTPNRLVRGNGPMGDAVVNYRNGVICAGRMPGAPLFEYRQGVLRKGDHVTVVGSFKGGKLYDKNMNVVAVVNPSQRRFYKGRMPVGTAMFYWEGDWPEAMLVYLAAVKYLGLDGSSVDIPKTQAAPAPKKNPEDGTYLVRAGGSTAKAVCTYHGKNIYDGIGFSGPFKYKVEGDYVYAQGFKKVATFEKRNGELVMVEGSGGANARVLWKQDGGYPQYVQPDGSFKVYSWGFDPMFGSLHEGKFDYQAAKAKNPTNPPIVSFDLSDGMAIPNPAKIFIAWKYFIEGK